jgi:hypothetical protein
MTKRIERRKISFLSEDQIQLLKNHFASQNTAMPHQIAVRLGIVYADALSVLALFESSGLTTNFLLIYHHCSEAPVDSMRSGTGFPKIPWICPHCEEEVVSAEDLRFDMLAKTIEDIEIV